MRARIVAIIALCVISTSLVAASPQPALASGSIWDLRASAWDTYLDATGGVAAAARNTTVLNLLFANVTPGSWVILPDDAVYATSGPINILAHDIVVTGTATIHALDKAGSAVMVSGDLVRIHGLRVWGSASLRSDRLSSPASDGFVLTGAGDVLDGVWVRDVAGAGILANGALLFTITSPLIADSQADGIHLTGGSAYGTIDDAVVLDSGDDGIAVVTYAGQPLVAHIVVNRPSVVRTRAAPAYPSSYAWGRGFVVSGGQDITFNDAYSLNSSSAALYVSSEPDTGWSTRGSTDVLFDGATIVGSNMDATLCAKPPPDACVDTGAILVWSARAPDGVISNVRFEDIGVVDTDAAASEQVALVTANGGSMDQILLRNLTFTGGPTPYLSLTGVADGDYASVCWKVDGGATLANHLGFTVPPPGVTCGLPSS